MTRYQQKRLFKRNHQEWLRNYFEPPGPDPQAWLFWHLATQMWRDP